MTASKRILVLSLCLISISGLWAQGKDFLLSLAIPGLSQVKNGRNFGYALMAAEAALIGGQLYFNSEAKLSRDESYTYALKFAHVNPGNYDSAFYKNLGKYDSSGFDALGYNAYIRERALSLYPGDPISQQQYIDEYAYGDDKYWNWDSGEHKSTYNGMRNDALDYESYAKLALGVTILNHLISGIDVLRAGSQDSKAQFSVDILENVPVLKLSVKF